MWRGLRRNESAILLARTLCRQGCAQYTVYTAEGRKRKTLYGKTRADVAKKLAKGLSDWEDGVVFDAENLTVGEYLDRWLNDSVKGNVGPRTLSNYQLQVRQHIRPTLGRIKLKT